MYKIDIPSASTTRPVYNPTTNGFFAEGTQVKDWLLNIIQEELANVVLDAGLSLDKQDNNQIVSATQSYISRLNDKYTLHGYFSVWVTWNGNRALTTPSEFISEGATYVGEQYMSGVLSSNNYMVNLFSTYYKMYVDVLEDITVSTHMLLVNNSCYLYVDDTLQGSSTHDAFDVDIPLTAGRHKIEFIHNNADKYSPMYFDLVMDLFQSRKVKYIGLEEAEANQW